MPKKPQKFADLGQKFGRPDLERIGLFIEMPYITGKRGAPKAIKSEGRNIMCEGQKTKNGTQHGYFDTIFKRVFSKEAIKGRGRPPPPPKFKNVSERPFVPPPGFKQHSSPGDYYGTFSGVIEAFSNKRKPGQPYKPQLRNCTTNPGKKGGPGYTDIGLSRYPEHLPDRFGLKPNYKEYGKNLGRALVTSHYTQDYFDPNPFKEREGAKTGPTYVRPTEKSLKVIGPGIIVPTGPSKWQGGCHDGCFNKFPEHIPDRYNPVEQKKTEEKIFYPQSRAQKSFYNTSVLNQNVDFRINKKNCEQFQPTYVKHLMNE